ncbi:MAG: tetratricopeptide repeat protein [Candidatus Omnitrophota bacterium]
MKKMKRFLITIAFFVSVVAGPGSLYAETTDCEEVIKAIKGAQTTQKALSIFMEGCSKRDSFEDHEICASLMNEALESDPNAKNADVLHYGVAQTRFNELTMLTKKNDIESVKRYMQLGEGYYNDALMHLVKASNVTQSKQLMLDITFLKFVISKERFQKDREEALFNDMANRIANFSDDMDLNKKQLYRIADKFEGAGLTGRALNLKVLYAKRVGPEGALPVAKDLKDKAGQLFANGEFKKAKALYQNYIELGKDIFEKGAMANNILEIADSYFANRKYAEAVKIYEEFLAAYSDHPEADLSAFRIAQCLYLSKVYQQAQMQLSSFLDIYPDSQWFKDAYRYLARLYYENPSKPAALNNLQGLMKRYTGKGSGDYAELLIGLLHYGGGDYEAALKSFENVERKHPDSIYRYAITTLKEDVENIRSGSTPAYGYAAEDTYRIWDPHAQIAAGIKLIGADYVRDGEDSIKATAKPGAQLKLAIVEVVDADRFEEYAYDKEDLSRLPRRISDGEEKDLVSINWEDPGVGKFLDVKQKPERTWQAPGSPGIYKISVKIDDLGLLRPPDEGSRKDTVTKELTALVTVE